jgi:hypothetical protein
VVEERSLRLAGSLRKASASRSDTIRWITWIAALGSSSVGLFGRGIVKSYLTW